MREKTIEQHLVRRVRESGGLALKFTSPNRRNVPDRIVLMPGGLVVFVELKAAGRKATAAQAREHERLRSLGFWVEVLDSKDGVERFIEEIA
ncbi:MAG: VRR-NUC domain-containing protein [Xanthomonadales bacterium]|nr:VRR-NUC domain-containing protein [Xanthomonadales bacterium]